MLFKLILLFVGLPLLELAILVRMGMWLGYWPTILLVIGTGVLGASLARLQGLRTWFQVQAELKEGRLPAGKMVDAFLIFIGGIVLLTPGLLTDILGFCLLIPFTRFFFKAWIEKKFREMLKKSTVEAKFLIT